MPFLTIYPDNFSNIYAVASAILIASASFWAIKKVINLLKKGN